MVPKAEVCTGVVWGLLSVRSGHREIRRWIEKISTSGHDFPRFSRGPASTREYDTHSSNAPPDELLVKGPQVISRTRSIIRPFTAWSGSAFVWAKASISTLHHLRSRTRWSTVRPRQGRRSRKVNV